MSVCSGFGRGELSCLDELDLVCREDPVGLGGAPLVLDARRELISEDIIGEVHFDGRRVGVEGEVEEKHSVSEHVLEGCHVVGDLGEEDGGSLIVAVVCFNDCVIDYCSRDRREKCVGNINCISGHLCGGLRGDESP